MDPFAITDERDLSFEDIERFVLEMVRRAREMLLGSAAGRGEGEARSAG